MAWIQLHQTLPKNKKTMKLKRFLKIKTPQAIGHLCMLWLWAIDNSNEGDLSEFESSDISEVCEWTKNPDDFISALIESGFLTPDLKINNWEEYIGKLLSLRETKKEQAKERQKRYRDKQKNTSDGDSENNTMRNVHVTQSNANVTHNNSVSNAPIDKSRVDKSRVDKSRVEYNEGDNARDDNENDVSRQAEPAPPSPYNEIMNTYNSICTSYPKIITVNSNRRTTLKNLIKAYSLEKIQEVFAKAEKSNFIKGENERQWQATFDWIIKPANFIKILEGNYDNKELQTEIKSNVYDRIDDATNGLKNHG